MLATWQLLDNGTYYYDKYNYLFDEVIRGTVLANTRPVSYIPSSTTYGHFQLDPYVPRYLNFTKDEIVGDSEWAGPIPKKEGGRAQR